MTTEQLQGLRLRLSKELAEIGATVPPPSDRILRLSRELAETEEALRAIGLGGSSDPATR